MEDYRTIRGTAVGEYEEKKSRFIAQLSFADSEEAAVAFLEQVRAANRTAREIGNATPTMASRPKRPGPRHWRCCSTAA